ncbi:MAG: DUF3108 domain-containing protein [Bacteroidota bacterium]
MKHIKYFLLLLVILIIFSFSLLFGTAIYFREKEQENPCNITNDAFTFGEEIVYKIWYNWGFIWLESGEVTFNVNADNYKGIDCYHFVSIGKTYPKYDWFYTVRDTFLAWVDTNNLRPFHFIRNTNEGQRFIYEDCYFNYAKKKIYSLTRWKHKMPRLDSTNINECSYDVLSLIYYSRNIDFSKYKVNDTIPLNMFLENKVYPTYLRYIGKDVYNAEGFGKFNCIKFRAKLIEGTLFSGGEQMTVWVTDDKNRIPLFIEAPITVGYVKAKMIKWKGLKYKIESKVQ